MLMTLLWWQIEDVGDRIIMLTTFYIISVIWIKSVTKIFHRSLVSQRCQQYILSPTTVDNIEVADKIKKFRSLEHMCLW